MLQVLLKNAAILFEVLCQAFGTHRFRTTGRSELAGFGKMTLVCEWIATCNRPANLANGTDLDRDGLMDLLAKMAW